MDAIMIALYCHEDPAQNHLLQKGPDRLLICLKRTVDEDNCLAFEKNVLSPPLSLSCRLNSPRAALERSLLYAERLGVTQAHVKGPQSCCCCCCREETFT